MELPVEYKNRMKQMLGDEYEEFIKSYDEAPVKGIRWNPLKCSLGTLKKSLPFSIEDTKFSPYIFKPEAYDRPGNLPAHHSGMFYMQEPSASSAVTVLAPEPGDKVLDLCAAPGGKATQIAAALKGSGLIWANEIVRERANILLSNTERMGIQNAVITAMHPDNLCGALQGFFDKVLVDAPCSGEGMFKKEPQAITAWSESSVKACAVRQLSILNSAAAAVKNQGILVYSTCTFSMEENEGVVLAFLREHPEFELIEAEAGFGRKAFDMPALRIFPMDGGEGHFAAKLRRISDAPKPKRQELCIKKRTSFEMTAQSMYKELFRDSLENQIMEAGGHIYILPKEMPDISGIPVIRAGVLFGGINGKRIQPSHHLFVSRSFWDIENTIDFSHENKELYKFMHGEEIDCDTKGYTAVSVNNVVLGFGKASGGRLKNHYPKGLRILK